MLTWKQVNGAWYCYKNGTIVKGWVQDTDNRWYYLNPTDGKMVTGWVQVNSKWYYLYPQKANNHYTGEMATGWIQVDSKWYYLYPQKTDNHYTGEMATGWVQVDSKWYYLYPQKTEKDSATHYAGEMATGWIQIDSKWYYLLTQKTEYNSNTHYTGEMVASTTMTINNKSYTFDASGVMQDGCNGLVSDNCINFIKGYETFRAQKYDDGTGTITQGYGCTGSEIADWGNTITEQQASDRLNSLINGTYAKPIKSNLDDKGISLTQNQFDAIVSLAYNINYSKVLGSTLYDYIVSGGRDADIIKTDFCMYNKAMVNGVLTVKEGLTKRRIAESNIFNYGVYDSTH